MKLFYLFSLLAMVACSSFGKNQEELLREKQLKFGEIGLAQSAGWHFKGSLKSPSSVLMEGPGYLKILRQRNRQFGNYVMVEFIRELSLWKLRRDPKSERLQIGDISNEVGGKTLQHKSHQNGLDVDIVYLRNNRHEEQVDRPYWEEYFVRKNQLSSNFDIDRNVELLLEVAHDRRVEKVFVDLVIKKKIVEYVETKLKEKEALLEQPVAAREGLSSLEGQEGASRESLELTMEAGGTLVEQLDVEALSFGGEQFSQSEKNFALAQVLEKLVPAKLHKTHFHVRLHCPEKDFECEGSRMQQSIQSDSLSQL
ncbi:penicillin-insensitive murein endopeptidase [bacterium]|nr:penicillin-insensitive murein endopeptidase [bacterium]